MKKILAFILAMVMVFTFAACGGDKTSISSKPVTENTNKNEVADTVMTPEALQMYYENYFASDDVGFAGECMTAESEGMKVTILANKEGENLFSMAIGENLFEIYKANDKTEYIHLKTISVEADDANEKIEATDNWYKYIPAETSENKEMFNFMSENFSAEELKVKADSIKSVKYDKTEDGIDYISVVSTEFEIEEGAATDSSDSEAYDVTWTFGIDSKTHKIVTVSQTMDDIVTTVTFSSADEINVTVPESVEPINEEGIMLGYMGILFSVMGDAPSFDSENVSEN